MREIKFRGQRVDNKEWVYGSLHEQEIECEKQYFKDGANNHYLAVVARPVIEVTDDSSSELLNDYAVIPSTVGQYTGLKDKNGVEIYEGDILDAGDRIVKVVWHEHCGVWDSKFISYKGKTTSNGIEAIDWKYRAEVIGNIHENKELLEETK